VRNVKGVSLFSLPNGPVRPLPGGMYGVAHLSPDGRWVAVSEMSNYNEAGGSENALKIIAADDSAPHQGCSCLIMPNWWLAEPTWDFE
jgi:hypothetical protein